MSLSRLTLSAIASLFVATAVLADESDRARFKSDLDERWDALPTDQKAAMTRKMEALRAARHADGGQ